MGIQHEAPVFLRFLVYQVSPEEIRLVDIRDTMDAEFAEDKNLWRASGGQGDSRRHLSDQDSRWRAGP